MVVRVRGPQRHWTMLAWLLIGASACSNIDSARISAERNRRECRALAICSVLAADMSARAYETCVAQKTESQMCEPASIDASFIACLRPTLPGLDPGVCIDQGRYRED